MAGGIRVRPGGPGLDGSPNARWIAIHTHLERSGDLWILPPDGSAPARQATRGGYEAGWPRGSPDESRIAFGVWRHETHFRMLDAPAAARRRGPRASAGHHRSPSAG